MDSVLFSVLPILVQLVSGLLVVSFDLRVFWQKILLVISPIYSLFLFVLQMLAKQTDLVFNVFVFDKVRADISMTFGITELFICSIITVILVCIQLSSVNINKKISGCLNIFSATMCFSVLSNSLFNFYIGIEGLGIVSAILIGLDNRGGFSRNSTKVFLYNKFASLLFLLAMILIAYRVKSLDFKAIKIAYQDVWNDQFLAWPALLITVSCLCKGAQLPFSRWLIDAASANIYVSVFLHSATIVGVGIIFITKCYFMFEAVPFLKNILIYVGGTTAVWMSISSIFHVDIKKIMVCSTAASMGLIFIASGIGEYSTSVLYFICHALSKSVFFLSFVYVINAMSGETNILRMGGLSSIMPNINDFVWIAFASTIGLPFFVSFFGKVSLLGDLVNNEKIAALVVFVNIISIIAFLRLVIVSMHGETSKSADDKVISRATDANSELLRPAWLLISLAVLGSFIAWSIYEWDVLHFGMMSSSVHRTNGVFDYINENIMELLQIAISVLLTIIFGRFSSGRHRKRFEIYVIRSVREGKFSEYLFSFASKFLGLLFFYVAEANRRMCYIIDNLCFFAVNDASVFLTAKHKSSVNIQALWILAGIATCFLCAY